MVNLTIDGQKVSGEEGTTVLEAARRAGIDIPALCNHPDLTPYGACRVCTVEIVRNGRSTVTTSCNYPVQEGIEVKTDSPRALRTRRTMVELLLARCPNVLPLQELAAELGIEETRFPAGDPAEDCILCGLCVRACEEIAGENVLGFVGRGTERRVTTAFETPYAGCVDCNKCVPYCPTGAIRNLKGLQIGQRLRAPGQRWVRLRQVVQYLALLLFVYLVARTIPGGESPIPVNIFSLFDPLMALSTMIASRQVIASFALAIITVLATLALGRVWCGWICPLGAVLNLFGPNGRTRVPERLRQAKYVLLLLILLPALLGSLTLMFLDPLCVFVRALGGMIYPAIQRVIGSPAQVQRPILPVLAIPFLVILGLNLIARRFWCRYLCPLGALLGLLSKVSWIKRRVDKNVCKKWGDCVEECPMGTISKEDFTSDPAECIMCLDCKPPCPVGAASFGKQPGLGPRHEYDFSRRQFLASLGMGAAWAGLLSAGLARRKSPHVLRPPGASEAEFLSKCVRCAQCIKVCPNSALQPSLLEGGLEGFWSPILVPRVGNCDYDCNACGQVCPSGAIPALSLEEKRKAVIGTAYVDRDRCISCMICVEECPVQAIVQVKVGDKEFPQVMPETCIGCGTCEYTCPIEGESAIRVYAPGACPVRPAPPPPPEATAEPEETKEAEETKEPEETPVEGSDNIAYVDRDLCIRCMICVKECPEQAIEEVEVDDLKFPQVVPERCIGCGICEENCPVDPKAIRLYPPDSYPGQTTTL